MAYQPSSLGDVRNAYSAQSMLQTWRQGQDVGDAYGFIPGLSDVVGGVVGGVVGPIAGMIHEGKQNKANREQEIAMARQGRKTMDKQAELYAAQAELAAAQADAASAGNAGTIAIASWLGGSVMIVGLAAVGIYAASQAKSRRKR
jgi:hypothetical protein